MPEAPASHTVRSPFSFGLGICEGSFLIYVYIYSLIVRFCTLREMFASKPRQPDGTVQSGRQFMPALAGNLHIWGGGLGVKVSRPQNPKHLKPPRRLLLGMEEFVESMAS